MRQEKAGIVLVRRMDDEIEFLMVKNLHSIGWAYLIENTHDIDEAFRNMYKHEIELMRTIDLDGFQTISHAHKEKYPTAELRVDLSTDLSLDLSTDESTGDLIGSSINDLIGSSINDLIGSSIKSQACDLIGDINELANLYVGNYQNPRYTFPKGDLEPGETSRQAAVRELHEETGILLNDDMLRADQSILVSNKYTTVRFWIVFTEDEYELEISSTDEIAEVRWVTYDKRLLWEVSCWYRSLLTNINPFLGRLLAPAYLCCSCKRFDLSRRVVKSPITSHAVLA